MDWSEGETGFIYSARSMLNSDGHSAHNSIVFISTVHEESTISMGAAILKSCATAASADWSIEETRLQSPSQNPAHAETSEDMWRRGRRISNRFDFWKQSPKTVSTCRRTPAHVGTHGNLCLRALALGHAGTRGDFCLPRRKSPLVTHSRFTARLSQKIIVRRQRGVK
jgi:hypothetical protein